MCTVSSQSKERENLQRQQSPPAVIRALVDAERYHASHVYFRAFPDSEETATGTGVSL